MMYGANYPRVQPYLMTHISGLTEISEVKGVGNRHPVW
jgi:hypothetical protein